MTTIGQIDEAALEQRPFDAGQASPRIAIPDSSFGVAPAKDDVEAFLRKQLEEERKQHDTVK